MPLYEYECDACGRRVEIIQKFSDPPLDRCPTCGGSVHKIQSAPAFQFKGSGWYITDYAKKAETPAGGDGPPKDGAGKGDKGATKDAEGGQKEASGKTDKPADKAPASGDAGSSAKSAPAPKGST